MVIKKYGNLPVQALLMSTVEEMLCDDDPVHTVINRKAMKISNSVLTKTLGDFL